TTRNFYRQASEYILEAAHSISRKTAAHERSRKRREIACVDFSIDFLECFFVLAPWGEGVFDLLVPGNLVASRDVCSQFRQLRRRQLINGLFNFRETHNQTLAVRVSFSITGDHELSDPTSNHCERIQEQGFAQFKAPWGCNLFTFALIGVFYRPILASMFALN